MVQKPLQKLFDKPMNRREFLAHLGAGALTVVGITGMIKGLSELGGRSQRESGYGSSSYGGSSKVK